MIKPVVVIPAYNPEPNTLLELAEKICQMEISGLIIVDDGSRPEHRPVFEQLAAMDGVKVLYHGENLGKGAALRTGFSHIIKFRIPCTTAVTMDADGQHLVDDVKKVIECAAQNKDVFILGVRAFKGRVPLRSRLGNRFTYLMFRGMVGQQVADTQTGLRAIPFSHLEKLCGLSADRYAYELEMLLTLIQDGLPVIEVPIRTVYQDNNAVSSFRPLQDSILVYRTLFLWWFTFRFKQLIKYSLSGVASTVADFGTYILLVNLSIGFVTASVFARMLSILIHFSSNRYITFSYKDTPRLSEIAKYMLVVLFNLLSSILFIYLFVHYLGMGEIIAKVVAQMLLFFATYTLLNGFVFLRSRRRRKDGIENDSE